MIELTIGSEVVIKGNVYCIEHFGRLSERIAIAATKKKSTVMNDPFEININLAGLRNIISKYYNDRKKVLEENGFSTVSIARSVKYIDNDIYAIMNTLIGDYNLDEIAEALNYVVESGRNLKQGEFSWFHYMSKAGNLAKVSHSNKLYMASIFESIQKDKNLNVKKVDKKYTQAEDNELGL